MPSNDVLEDDNSPDLIPSILNGSPFKLRPDEEKLDILKKGRPLPKLNIIKRDSSRNCNRTFQPSWYSIHNWLCGSKSYNKLFCWPCLLMRPETSSWCSIGNDDMKRFTSMATKHALCKSHLKAISEYHVTINNFNLPPDPIQNLNFKCKEEDMWDKTDVEDDDFDNYFKDESNPKKIETEDREKFWARASPQGKSSGVGNSKGDSSETPKVRSQITFQAWKEMNKESLPVLSSRFFEDSKLCKWKRKIAKQELKNARLTGEKLKFEIEVLKTKAEYYKILKESLSKDERPLMEKCSAEVIQSDNLNS